MRGAMTENLRCVRLRSGTVCGGTLDPDGFCDRCGHKSDSDQKSISDSALSARTGTRMTWRATTATGLVSLPIVEQDDPRRALMTNPVVPISKRTCRCGRPTGRDGSPPPTEGVCQCGRAFSYAPRLTKGDVVSGQYQVEGCIAHGGLGWIYLARDRNLDDSWVVLKGLLNEDDTDAADAAIAERRFLIEVKHPNIVQIRNFVEQDGAGYIVMEYLPGKTIRELRQRVDGHRILPVDSAIEFILAILPAFEYLHDLGLLYCDFKPDNVINTVNAVKLIDLGAVYQIGMSTVHFGTKGYQAPEVAESGPSVASDLYTVGRTLAILCADFEERTTKYEYTLAGPAEIPLFDKFDSLYRFLLRATAFRPAERFASAAEMRAQLLLIQYEIVATLRGNVEAPRSTIFAVERHPAVAGVDPNALPKLLDRSGDGVPLPLEASIRAAQSLLDAGRIAEVNAVCASIEAADPDEWRATWLRGVGGFRRGEISAARKCFEQVYARIPGETGPKLALAFAAESDGDIRCAVRLYDTVSRTSPATTSAAFGLARCAIGLGERQRTLDAYRRVPHGARSWVKARVETVRVLIQRTDSHSPTWSDLVAASEVLDGIELEPPQRAELESQLLGEVLARLQSGDAPPSGVTKLVASPLTERNVRHGIESAYRTLARYSTTRSERIVFVDRANSVRARSWI